MAFWIFKCDPAGYHLDERLLDSEAQISWRITRFKEDIQKHDTVFVWEIGPALSVRATFVLTTNPETIPEIESEQRFNVFRDTDVTCRVLGRLDKRNISLKKSTLKKYDELQHLSGVFRGPYQGTNFRVSDSEGAFLLSLI